MKTTVLTQGLDKYKADVVIVGVGPKAKHSAALRRLFAGHNKSLLRGLPTGFKQLAVLQDRGPHRCVLLTEALPAKADANAISARLRMLARTCAARGFEKVALDAPSLLRQSDPAAALEVLRLATQVFGSEDYEFKIGRRPASGTVRSLAVRCGGTATAQRRALRIGEAIAAGMRACKHLGEQPPNELYPATLAKQAQALGREHKLRVSVLDDKALARLKMNGLLTVGRGSARPPRLIVLRHAGNASSRHRKPLCLVGKGITFDTGGNSLKPGTAMVDMKFDMCGAASVIGTLVACARMKLPLPVVGVIPTAENMVAGDSFRPDDIITMMDGQKVEILNTDAEGRLILADALTYAQKYLKPAAIIDAATLTGACLVALGQHRTGLMASDDKLAERLFAAGEASGDPCWRLPLDPEYDRLLKSEYADFANIGGGRNAGTITAACFLQRFVDRKLPWAHLDIAGTAWHSRRATGRPVPLLASFLAREAKLLA